MLAIVPPAHDGATGYLIRVITAEVPPARAYPDLTDDATVGCLVGMARKVRRDPSWRPTPVGHDPGTVEWVVDPPSARRQTLHPSEISAIVAVLCSRPPREGRPDVEPKHNLDGMAVTVTLVFSDEAHREAWLRREGLFDGPRGGAQRQDYEHRRSNTNLTYLIAPEGP